LDTCWWSARCSPPTSDRELLHRPFLYGTSAELRHDATSSELRAQYVRHEHGASARRHVWEDVYVFIRHERGASARRHELGASGPICTARARSFGATVRPTTAGRRGALPVHAPGGLRASTCLDPMDLLRQPSNGSYVCSTNVSIYGPRVGAVLGHRWPPCWAD
jgi:hypothetical protein